jgi:hypothetical protein
MEISLWFILAQIMGVIVICFEFVSYQIPDQRRYLLVTSIGNIFWALMFLFIGFHSSLGSIQAMIVAAVFGVARGLLFWWIFGKNTRRRRIAGRVVLYVSLAIVLPVTLMSIVKLPHSQQVIIQSLGLAGGMLFIVGQYLPSKHYLRAFVTFYATMVLIGQTPLNLIDENGVGTWNVMGILIELAKITSVIVFYTLLWHRNWARRKLKEIKKAINSELGKITAYSDTSQLVAAKVISAADIERLVVKMVKYQLSAIDKGDMVDIQSTIKKTKAVFNSLETVQGVKDIMQILGEAEEQGVEQKPIPRISRFHKQIREIIWKNGDEVEEPD